jgi:UDP-2,4-diacetamido-2,4,6-trideoxy-beta-L-altropyranose hydrolase
MSGPVEIRLRRVDPSADSPDSRALWEWRNDPLARAMSRNSAEIPWESHRQWYERAAVADDRVLLIAELEGSPIGMARFDLHTGRTSAEISLNLAPLARGRQLSGPLLDAAKDYVFATLRLQRLDAVIKPENSVSIHVFESAGFEFRETRDGLNYYVLE